MRYDHESILQLIALSQTVHKYMEWYIIKLVAVMKEMKKKVAKKIKYSSPKPWHCFSKISA